MLYEHVIRPALFCLDAETAHHLTMSMMSAAQALGFGRAFLNSVPQDPVEVMGLKFPNRLGLAAGLDKNGEAVDAFGALGFGFIETGTVTPSAQPGNPRPRLFRLIKEQSIINRMGFNNHGAANLVQNVAGRRYKGILGINIGRNNTTPLEKAGDDYAECLRTKMGWSLVEDAGRGYRRVVCSPKPRRILELDSIRTLLNNHHVVIACGGGGIPVNYTTNSVMGTTGVIDKDRASALLAYNLGAELYMIITGVDKVCINFGKPDQKAIDVMTVSEAKKYLAEGQFPPGSMGPKIQSAIEYVEKGGKEAIITSQENITNAMIKPNCCTRIVRD